MGRSRDRLVRALKTKVQFARDEIAWIVDKFENRPEYVELVNELIAVPWPDRESMFREAGGVRECKLMPASETE